MLRRRQLLSSTAAAWATGAYALWPGLSTALATAPTPAQARPAHKLVVVMLRGAVDGLSVVVPHGDAGYRQSRGSIALPAPGSADGSVLPL
ncbi:MAG: hypothetical protein ACKOJ7_05615, partial [Betaproteobacteria bacterium]